MSDRESLFAALFRWRYGPRIDPTQREVVKFVPDSPPRVGGVILVDGKRHRVTRAKVSWDGPRWTLHDLRAKPDPPGTTL